MKVRHQKQKCRTNEDRHLHIINKQRMRKKTEILHADLSRDVIAYYFNKNKKRSFEVARIHDDKDVLIDEGFNYLNDDYLNDYYYDELPIKSVIGWRYNDRYNPYDY